MGRRMLTEKVHDRRAKDVTINSRIAIAIVDDPYSRVGEKITVTRSVRDDPLADMLSRSVIDRAMFEAGRHWQRLHELTEIGPISAIDTTKEPVDGGRMPEPLTDKQIEAVRKIAAADKMLGQQGAALVRDLLALGLTVGQMCEKHDCRTARRSNFLSMRMRECLNDLAKHFGYAG